MPVSPLVRDSHSLVANATTPSLLVASLIQTRGVSQDDTSDPDSRTIQGIVWSCLATIFACTWIAIHPNIPDAQDSWWQQQGKRIGLMIMALAAPEVVILWALKQRIAAAAIMKKYNRTLSDISVTHDASRSHHDCVDTSSTHIRKRPQWCLSHGFFIQMGGFVLVYERTYDPIKVLDFSLLHRMMLKGDLNPVEISEGELADRSKGDFLTKLLVVLQTSWFMAQCITRWISKLPVTELEVMTFSFAVLNIITYGLWWEKPQNVTKFVRVPLKHPSGSSPLAGDEPTQPASSLRSNQSMESVLSTVYLRRLGLASPVPSRSPSPFHEFSDPTRTLGASNVEMDITELTLTREGYHSKEMSLHEQPEPSLAAIPQSPSVPCSHQQQPIAAGILDAINNWRPPHHITSIWLRWRRSITVNVKHCCRVIYRFLSAIWKSKAFHSLASLISVEPKPADTPSRPPTSTSAELSRAQVGQEYRDHQLGVHTKSCAVGMFHAADNVLSVTDRTVLAVFGIMVGLLFGGLHLLAYWSTFPTRVEACIWRVAALYTMIYPIGLSLPLGLLLLLALPIDQFTLFRDFLYIFLIRYKGLWALKLIIVILPFYVVARLAIIILAFTTLRALPPDAFKDVSWSSFFPHL